jgi:hypothetical protein
LADWKIGLQYQNDGYPYLSNVEVPNKFDIHSLFTAPYPNRIWGMLEDFNDGYPMIIEQSDARLNKFDLNDLFTAPYPSNIWTVLKNVNDGYPSLMNQIEETPALDKVDKPTWNNGIINWVYPGDIENVENFKIDLYLNGFLYETHIVDGSITSYDFQQYIDESEFSSFQVTVQALGNNIAYLDGAVSEMSDGFPILHKEVNMPVLETVNNIIWQNGVIRWNYPDLSGNVKQFKLILYINGFVYNTYIVDSDVRSYDFSSILQLGNYYQVTVQALGNNISFLDSAISKKANYLHSVTVKNKTIKVYQSDYKQNVGDLKAVIVDFFSDTLTEDLSGTYTFDFTTVIDEEKSQYLTVGNIVEINGDYFRIVYTEENRNSDDTLTIAVQTEHVNYDLMLDDYKMEYFTSDGTAFDMLLELLSGTEFNIDFVDDDFNVVKTISAQESLVKRDALFLIAAAYNAEIVFNRFSVSLVKKRGANKGLYFAYRKNIKNISRIVDGRKRVNNQPTVSYSLSVALLKELLGEEEDFEVGDVVKVYDYKLGIDIETRILSISKSISEETGDVEIGNFIPDFVDSVNQIERSTVHKERLYNGIRIGPENGFEAIRSDKKARTTMNATEGIKIDLGDGEGNYAPVFYVTIEGEEAKLNLKGNAEFTGQVLASLISASNIEGGSIDIGNGVFTVDNAGRMSATSAYIQGLIEASEFIGGKIIITNEAETERVILCAEEGFRFQAWDENAGEEGEWIDSIWMEDGKGKFFGEIISSTITGGLIRTAESGRRIEISENQIRCYNDDGELHGLVTNNSSGNFGDWDFYDNGTLVFRVYNTLGGGGVSLIPENEASLVVGREGYILGLNGNIVLNERIVPSIASKTAGINYGENEQQMLQELHDKIKQLLDAINNN